MNKEMVMTGEERFVRDLRFLFASYGYKQYRMSKFEEYALYGGNIDFLVSDSVITFTDTDGKLMALKPDVTLSIVKNAPDDEKSLAKVCYNENVYRVSKGTGSFREIMQSGVECIGDVDPVIVGEMLVMAAKSLALTGRRYVLEVSHLGFIGRAIARATGDAALRADIAKRVGEKNIHGIAELCRDRTDRASAERICALASVYGSPREVEEKLRGLIYDEEDEKDLEYLTSALSAPGGAGLSDKVSVDLSVTADANYYNGIVFKGFVEGVPESVLSGGQYDRLMKKMGRRSRAVGFAVYVDTLERLFDDAGEYDFDVLLVYPDGASPEGVAAAAEKIRAGGETVCSAKSENGARCRRTVYYGR